MFQSADQRLRGAYRCVSPRENHAQRDSTEARQCKSSCGRRGGLRAPRWETRHRFLLKGRPQRDVCLLNERATNPPRCRFSGRRGGSE
ncbi:hypothetical protein E2C01_033588 [Portunus trituberculatus]|uniref:Uncharacterized protein n=1 Tax=Portunus trituberculatus TaxID=210409 RepID=A0A5B7F4L7_PORTR|nr:hypothetical protein [Portunus trituberculatus]